MDTPTTPTIKHLVIPGGMVYGFAFYGALRQLAQTGVWDIQHIRTIHATSVGGIFAVLLALQYEWEVCDKYLVERPWQHVFPFSFGAIMNSFQNTGIFGIECLEAALTPLLEGKDLAKTVTLAEFHEKTQIALHLFTIDLSTFDLVDVSYRTHPHWTVIEAVYASACAPIFFKPFQKDGVLYTDGGYLANYPIHPLLTGYPEVCRDEILAIHINRRARQQGGGYYFGDPGTHTMTLYDYLLELLFKLMEKIAPKEKITLKHEVFVDSSYFPVLDLYGVVNSPEVRRQLVDYGVASACGLPPP